MLKLLIVIAALLVPLAASADPVKLSIRTALDLGAALAALDGYDKTVKDGATERTVRMSYQLSSNVRLAIGRNITKLKEITLAFQKAGRDKRAEVTAREGGDIKPGSAAEIQLNNDLTEMMDADAGPLDLTKFKPEELGLGGGVDNP